MKTYTKITAGIAFTLFFACLIPILMLARYNHPTGDDYYYVLETHNAWQEKHDPFSVLHAAAEGVTKQYQIWQGTYSAMFFMYLSPNLFGESVYHFVTPIILLLLTGGIFYCIRQIVVGLLDGTRSEWLCISALLSLLCVQTTAFASESFFWYNGSMYYTGFLGLTFFYFGLLCKLLKRGNIPACIVSCVLAFLLAGGNYVSLLPTMLLSLSLLGLLFLQKKKNFLFLIPPCLSLLIGFTISALAPGNHVRQDGMWKIPAWKAVLKALLQGIDFLTGWSSVWILLALLLLTPIFWGIYERLSFSFPLPLLVIGFGYGLLCSMACPTFYTMNSTGPARAVAIMYYVFLFFVLFSYFYLLGYLHRITKQKGERLAALHATITGFFQKRLPLFVGAFIVLLLLVLSFGNTSSLVCLRALRTMTNGDAASYEAQFQERLSTLRDDSLQDIIWKSYHPQADLLYVGDFSDDPLEPTNVIVAQYYGKNSICVVYEP